MQQVVTLNHSSLFFIHLKGEFTRLFFFYCVTKLLQNCYKKYSKQKKRKKKKKFIHTRKIIYLPQRLIENFFSSAILRFYKIYFTKPNQTITYFEKLPPLRQIQKIHFSKPRLRYDHRIQILGWLNFC